MTRTPPDLTITPRDLRFGRGQAMRRWWLADDPVATAFWNALSVTFPKGEGYFVENVRHFRDGTPPRLEREINAFIRQEVMHTREHVAFNRHVTDQGYDVSLLDAHVDEALALTDDRPAIVKLATTMALEHFTAILAHQLLADPRHLAGAEPQAAAMWRWHAAEEIEHKGVAYDTWLHATRDWPRPRRWLVKALTMLRATRKFFVDRYRGMIELLRQDGITGVRAHRAVLAYALVRPGIARKIFGTWFGYFLPSFHPWKVDDRHLIARAESDYADAVLPPETRAAA
jgi:predicted metal-dependent hydrolase